jgi:hypothetical protein
MILKIKQGISYCYLFFLIKSVDVIEMYIPMKQNIKDLGVDFPIIKCKMSLFEKGIKIISEKLGSSIILFSEVGKIKIN